MKNMMRKDKMNMPDGGRIFRKGIRNILVTMLVLLPLTLGGCGSRERTPEPAGQDGSRSVSTTLADNRSEEETMTGADGYKKALAFMIEKYGFTAEELMGLDVEKIIEDYNLDTMDYSADEVRQIIEDEKDYYRIEPEDDIFSLIGNTGEIPAGADLTADSDIVKIAFYENPGSLQRRMLFDLENKVYFVDDALPYEMSEEKVNILKNIAADTDLPNWQHSYKRDDEKETTGSYRWKMVFLLRDGTQCAYGGYTADMTTLPENYSAVKEILEKAAQEE